MFQPNEPNLSEAERTRSPGVVVVYYADEDDYRARWFSELDFFDAEIGAEGQTFGEIWEAGEEPIAVTEELVKSFYLPRFLDAMRATREASDEPPHLAYEVYWRGFLLWQHLVESGEAGEEDA